MRWGISLISWCLCLVAFAAVELTPVDPSVINRPGEVTAAWAETNDEQLATKLNRSAWRSVGKAEFFVVMDVSTPERVATGFRQRLQLVLGPKFSPDQTYQLHLTSGSTELRFKGWTWSPQPEKIDPNFFYEDLSLLNLNWWKRHISLWLGALAFLLFLSWWPLARYLAKRRLRLNERRHREEWLRRISEAQTLADFSTLWLERDELKECFPGTDVACGKFFTELNRFQFRPQITPEELKELSGHKEQLLRELKGGASGV